MPLLHMASGSSPSSGSFRDPTPRSHSHGTMMTQGQGGGVANIMEHLRDLQARGPAWVYYPEPTKSILAVAPGNVAQAEEHFRGLGIKVVTGHRYLGVYIGDKEAEGGGWRRRSRGGKI